MRRNQKIGSYLCSQGFYARIISLGMKWADILGGLAHMVERSLSM